MEVIHLIKLLETPGQLYNLGDKVSLLESGKRNSTVVEFILFLRLMEDVCGCAGSACQMLRKGVLLPRKGDFYQSAK